MENGEKKAPRITIKEEKAGKDPSITISRVELHGHTGFWPETFGSKEAREAFLRGVDAGSSMPELYGVSPELLR